MLRRILGVSVALLLLGALPAQAQDDEEDAPIEYGRIGGYAGLAGSYGIDVSKGDFRGVTFDSGGVSAWLGYRMHTLAAFEVEGEWQNGLSDVNGWNITLNVNWYLFNYFFEPNTWVQPFLVTGGGLMSARPPGARTAVNGAFRLGVGLDAYLTRNWSFRFTTEWVTGVGRLNDLSYVPIAFGVQYNW